MRLFYFNFFILYLLISPLSLSALDKTASINDVNVTESDDNTTTIEFTVNGYSNDATDTISYIVYHGTTDSNDINSSDMNGTVPFSASTDTATITIHIIGDNIPEVDETFTVVLYDLNSTRTESISDAIGIGTIFNDDTQAWPPIIGDIPDQSVLTTTYYELNISNYVSEVDSNDTTVNSYRLFYPDTNTTFTPTNDLSFVNGVLSGTPTVRDTYNLAVYATDDDGNSNTVEFTLSVEDINDIFCYGYSYKQQGLVFTEDNNGTEAPMLAGNVALDEPINISIYIKNKSAIDVSDLNITVFKDVNTSQVEYISNSTTFVDAGRADATSVTDSADVDKVAVVEVGPIEGSEFTFVYYDLNPNAYVLNEPIDIDLTFNINDTVTTQTLGDQIHMCTPSGSGSEYQPTFKIFNVELKSLFDTYPSPGQKYNLPTQIVKRADDFKVVAYNINNTNTRDNFTGGVWVELINIGTFGDADADCNNPGSSISAEVKVLFDTNSTNEDFTADVINNDVITGITSADFYRTANENTAFRVSYEVVGEDGAILESHREDNGWIIDNFTDLASGIASFNAGLGLPPNEQNKCYKPVVVGNHTYTTMPESCGNNADKNPIDDEQYAICLECIHGYNTRYACSRDNFAIRPEAFMIKINDQNQTGTGELRIVDDISGVSSATTPANSEVNLAAGYDYKLEFTATNSVDNTASYGYTTSLTTNYAWEPRTVTPIGCEEYNGTIPSVVFQNGYKSLDSNLSQVGEYKLSLLDTSWTLVDQNASHHTGTYYLATANSDCVIDSSSVTAVGSSTPNGCNISSSHINTDSSLIYRDYNVTFHPYKFDLNDINSSVGLNNDAVTTTSYIYMADMNKSQEMSYHLNGYIIAKGYNDSNLSNFVTGCYAKPVDINITRTMDHNVTNVAYQYRFNTLNASDVNISTITGDLNNTAGPIQLSEGNFTTVVERGSLNSNLNLNFFRESNNSINPRKVEFHTYSVDCTNADVNCSFSADLTTKTTHGELSLDHNITHLYGRTHAARHRFKETGGDAFIYYEAFCSSTDTESVSCNKTILPNSTASTSVDDPRWFKNPLHNPINDGTTGSINQKGYAINDGHVNSTTSPGIITETTGKAQVELLYDGNRGYPYKTTMENNASSWLIYNKYNASATKNEFEVEFESSGEWAGEHETNTTTRTPEAIRTNRRTMW